MDEARRRSGGLGVFIPAALAMLVFYPLSSGPVGWAIIRCGSPGWTQPAFELVYGPLIWLQDFGPAPLSKLLSWYFEWWWR